MPSHTELERLKRRLESEQVSGPGLQQARRLHLQLPATRRIIPFQMPEIRRELPSSAPAVPERTPITDALRRAAVGFASGVAATPAGAGADPGLGGVIGAIGGFGETLRRAQKARTRREELLLEPQIEGLRETARQEARKPFRAAEFTRKTEAQTERDRKRSEQISSRDVKRAQRAAGARGISFSDALRIRQQARKEVQQEMAFLGSFPGDPAFEVAVDTREDKLLDSAQATVGGVKRPTPGGGQDDLQNILFK